MKTKTIKVLVEGGLVREISGIPLGYSVVVNDYDVTDDRDVYVDGNGRNYHIEVFERPEKIGVKEIRITRVEGPSALCGKEKVFSSFNEANAWLRRESYHFPEQGYDKHDFSVTWEDGEKYTGRLDCKHNTCEDNDLDVGKHIKSFLLWHSGTATNPWCGKGKYEEIMASETDERKQECLDFLQNYEL